MHVEAAQGRVSPFPRRALPVGVDHSGSAKRILLIDPAKSHHYIGRLLVVDFAPHDLEFLRDEHAHRRLGFAPETVTQWMKAAGLDVVAQTNLAPEPASDGKVAVSLWLGRDPRIVLAAPAREVA